jgi:hypothetical protein
VSKIFYDLSLRFAADFSEYRRLRAHVDFSEDENILIYPYYQHTLQRLIEEDSNFSDAVWKKILQQTGEVIK